MRRMTLVQKTEESVRERNNEYYKRNSTKVQAQRRARKNTSIRGRMLAIIGNARSRAKRENWEFDLTLDFLCALFEEQNGKCALTGETLTLVKEETRWESSLASLDRIDSKKGYTQSNVWLTTTKANFAKGTQTYKEFVEMCKKVVEKANA